jgi:hypothetical protein
MSKTEQHNRRWLEWTPTGRILEDSAEGEPTKPSKPGSGGFVGASSTPVPEIAVDCPRREERLMSWCEWKAAALNRLFLEQGVIGKPGRITAETVRHSEQKQGEMNKLQAKHSLERICR